MACGVSNGKVIDDVTSRDLERSNSWPKCYL